MIYDLLFSNHTIELTSEHNQSPLWRIGRGHTELQAEIRAWLQQPTQQNWIMKQQERETNCPKIYGPFTSTTLFTCDLSMSNAKAVMDELALDTHPGFPVEGMDADPKPTLDERGYEDVKHLRIDARGLTLSEVFDLEIDMQHFFTNPALEIVVSAKLGWLLCRLESRGEQREPDCCTMCCYLFPRSYIPHLRQDCTCVLLQRTPGLEDGEEQLVRVLEVKGEEAV